MGITTLDNLNSYYSGNKNQRQYRKCFMTGKSCIYQRHIQGILNDLLKSTSNEMTGSAFMLMPFKNILDQVYKTQIEPCLKTVVKHVRRADEISMTGFIICEKICKEIQEAKLICAEISSDNHNVFYELGLAFSLEKPITLLVQNSLKKDREKKIFKLLALTENMINFYEPFEMLRHETIKLWTFDKTSISSSSEDSILILLADTSDFQETINIKNFKYAIDKLCKSAIHRSLNKCKAWDNLSKNTITLKDNKYLDDENKEITFNQVRNYIVNSRCVIICTSEYEPCSYFWLGFAHGLDKYVVPISVPCQNEAEDINPQSQLEYKNIQENGISKKRKTLPFDVRALWHIYFTEDKYKEFENQLDNILTVISNKDIDIVNRKNFWGKFIEDGRVSIFVGSVELTKNNRHVVGEWDYRTVSELSSFFTSMKETMETTIQTPTFQASQFLLKENVTEKINKYIEDISNRMYSGNSIIIASADVNDMTEVALAKFVGIKPFESDRWKHANFNGAVAFKEQREKDSSNENQNSSNIYFQIKPIDNNSEEESRGFYDIQGGSEHKDRTYKSKYTPYSKKSEKGYSIYFGHVAKFQLPNSPYWTVILQGITGPATLGIAQALTGAKYKQFTIFHSDYFENFSMETKIVNEIKSKSDSFKKLYDEDFKNALDKNSEDISLKLEKAFQENKSVEAIIKVYILDKADPTHDERKIIWWDFALKPREIARLTN